MDEFVEFFRNEYTVLRGHVGNGTPYIDINIQGVQLSMKQWKTLISS